MLTTNRAQCWSTSNGLRSWGCEAPNPEAKRSDRRVGVINPRMPALAKSARAALKVFQGHSRGELNQLLFGKVPAQFCIKLITHIRRRIGHGVRHASKATSAGANPSMRPSRIAAISSSLNPYILPPAEFASIQKEQPTRTAVRSVNNMRCRCGTGAFCPKSHSPSAFTQNTRGTRAAIFCGWDPGPAFCAPFWTLAALGKMSAAVRFPRFLPHPLPSSPYRWSVSPAGRFITPVLESLYGRARFSPQSSVRSFIKWSSVLFVWGKNDFVFPPEGRLHTPAISRTSDPHAGHFAHTLSLFRTGYRLERQTGQMNLFLEIHSHYPSFGRGRAGC